MNDFEKLGAFYLGRAADNPEELVLYDSRDLTTHAMCVGMTGSGKTGLCIGILEEAAIDGIPAIVVDPKGDMTNLMLNFPELRPEDFRPWVSEDDARRKGVEVDQLAEMEAEKWKAGIASYGQDASRIVKMRETTEFTIYTPGSVSGRPVSIIKLLDVPQAAILKDEEVFNEYVSGTSGSLLGLLGLDADPLNSRDHILISTILTDAWKKNENLTIHQLIENIQKPSFSQVGVMNIEQFYPEKDRFNLALRFNNLLASPQFSAWTQGDVLDIQNLLYTASGQPRLSILSISHLNDQERMFFVTLLLNRLIGWVRQQPGTSSLRAMFYMDEIFGYFPPVANPPSKQPLLTLLKQARAYGVGLMLTTQNPVDLDYKGLSNMGTWFIGRLQTERDKARLLDGLESALPGGFDRSEIDQLLSSLKPRQFLMNNVHDTGPTLFESRFVLSYLAGPLSRDQIRKLAGSESTSVAANVPSDITAGVAAGSTPVEAAATPLIEEQPIETPAPVVAAATAPSLPSDIPVHYVASRAVGETVYRPALFGIVDVHFNDQRNGIDYSREEHYATLLTDGLISADWSKPTENEVLPEQLTSSPDGAGVFENLPADAMKKASYNGWSRDLQDHVFRTSHLPLFKNNALKSLSRPEESERDFVIRLQIESREQRDKDLEALRSKYESARRTIEERVRKAKQTVERQKQAANESKLQTMISIGSTILGSFLGKKAVSSGTIGRATTAARSASRTARQSGNVDRAEETVETLEARIQEMEEEFNKDIEALNAKYDGKTEALEHFELRPLKRDVLVRAVTLTWLPYERQASGELREAW